MKYRIPFIVMIVLALLLTACGSNQATNVPATNTPHPIVAAATSRPTASATAVPATSAAAAKPGVITGTVYGMTPPTPPMMVYAVDQATGKWARSKPNQVIALGLSPCKSRRVPIRSLRLTWVGTMSFLATHKIA